MAEGRPNSRDNFREREARLASMVRAAGGYVVPSDDLRPRTLEAARERTRNQRTFWRLASVALALAVLLVSGAVTRRSGRELQHSARWKQVQSEAIERAAAPGIGRAWALVEAMIQWRAHQAEMFEEDVAKTER